MEPVRPFVDFFQHPQWRWPAWNFGLECDDLFWTLHYKYNTYETPLQDFEAFHHDVCEVANQASSADEFHQLLAARKQLRLEELVSCFKDVGTQLAARPHLSPDDTWPRAIQLFGTKSLDSLVAYFAAFIPVDERSSIRAPRKDVTGGTSIHDTPDPTSNTAPADVKMVPTPSDDSDSADKAKPMASLQSPPSKRQTARRCSPGKAHHRVAKRSRGDSRKSQSAKRSVSRPVDQIPDGARYHLRPRVTRQKQPAS